MIPVLSRSQMRAFDRCAIEDCQVPGVVLMENAGRGAADVLSALIAAEPPRRRTSMAQRRAVFPTRHVRAPGQPASYPLDARVVIVCGTGNNGGDGFVVARHLLARGAEVSVVLTGVAEQVTGEARINHDAFVDLGGTCSELPADASLKPLIEELRDADFVVDAIFGTGLTRPIEGHLVQVIDAINDARARTVALDVPSGLDADSGAPLGTAVRADHTVTFGHLKVGLLTPDGARLAGQVHVVDLGVADARILEQVGHTAQVLDPLEVGSYFIPREANVHKHAAGNVLVVAGSPGKLGAAKLTARAAMRAGAGLVTLCTWPEAARSIEAQVVEVMTARMDRDAIGSSLDAALEGRHVVAMGPGFGLDEAARRAIEHVVLGWDGLKVVDADAITAFVGRAKDLASAKGSVVLTPHPGELGRLLGRSGSDIEQDRFGAVREAVQITGAVVVLKGARTIIALPDGRLYVAVAGNPALATAGSGDVLTGIIAALGCSMRPDRATCAGVLVHALAADQWSASTGSDRGLLAGEIGEMVPGVIAGLMKRAEESGL
ncbi:MAG: NAD(P)H-hydrate dehydratase [Polyangiaceae bacterium]|nr:NAD(P)H-hydrate dehydratase [Polyangiaceae bacterium]